MYALEKRRIIIGECQLLALIKICHSGLKKFALSLFFLTSNLKVSRVIDGE